MKRNFNLGAVNLDVHRELNIAIKIIATDIERGISKKKQFGLSFAPNAQATIDKKGFDHRLLDKGIMFDTRKMQITEADKQNQVVTLLPHEDRIEAAYYNDNGTENIPKTPFWGISKRSEKLIMQVMEKKIESTLKNA